MVLRTYKGFKDPDRGWFCWQFIKRITHRAERRAGKAKVKEHLIGEVTLSPAEVNRLRAEKMG